MVISMKTVQEEIIALLPNQEEYLIGFADPRRHRLDRKNRFTGIKDVRSQIKISNSAYRL